MDALLRNEPLFVAVVEDEPSLREPLRDGAPEGPARRASEARRLLVGQRLLSPQLWRYVPRASDAAALALGRALVATLARTCRRATRSSAIASSSRRWPGRLGQRGLGPGRRPARGAAGRRGVRARRVGGAARSTRGREGARRGLRPASGAATGRTSTCSGDAQAPGADRARVCAMTIALYSELVALPPGTAGPTLRHVLGPAEPAADAPPARGRPLNAGRAQPFFAFQASRTCASRSGSMPARSLACRSAGSVFHQARVSVGGLRERPEGEAGGDGLLVAAAVGARGVPGGGDPDRHVAPGADLLLLEEVRRRPDEAGASSRWPPLDAVEHAAHRELRGRAHGVEDAERARLDHADRPLGEVAGVDELHRVLAVAGGEHVAAAGEAHRPVGEAVALVARADDQARAGSPS